MEQKLPLIGQPSLPEAQHRRAHAVRRTGQRYHVHLHVRVYHHLLPCLTLGDGVDLIPQKSCRFKFQPVGGFLHPFVEGFEDVLFAVADQVHRAL